VLCDPSAAGGPSLRRLFSYRGQGGSFFSDSCPKRSRIPPRARVRCNLAARAGNKPLPSFRRHGDSQPSRTLSCGRPDGRGRLAALYPDAGAARRIESLCYLQLLDFEPTSSRGFSRATPQSSPTSQLGKSNGVRETWGGPVRGSGAGAGLRSSLGITYLDPLRYDLLFEPS